MGIDYQVIDYKEIKEKIKQINKAENDNENLIISEKKDKVYLPYTIYELEMYRKNYPMDYNSLKNVVAKEFTLQLTPLIEHPYKSRFIETYNLLKNKVGKSLILSFLYALKVMINRNANAAIIAACRYEEDLKCYLECLADNSLENFKNFNIIYDMSLTVKK